MWEAIGLGQFAWSTNLWSARAFIILGDSWQWIPFIFVVMLAALENVPRDFVEAAEVDGAGRWQILLPLSILVCLAAACSATQPAAQVDQPRQVSLAESSECRNLGLIVKRSARHSKQSFNTNQAMKDAMDAVLASGADSYQLLDVDDEGHGTQVIMQAFACP
jgi:hypothetical protein